MPPSSPPPLSSSPSSAFCNAANWIWIQEVFPVSLIKISQKLYSSGTKMVLTRVLNTLWPKQCSSNQNLGLSEPLVCTMAGIPNKFNFIGSARRQYRLNSKNLMWLSEHQMAISIPTIPKVGKVKVMSYSLWQLLLWWPSALNRFLYCISLHQEYLTQAQLEKNHMRTCMSNLSMRVVLMFPQIYYLVWC